MKIRNCRDLTGKDFDKALDAGQELYDLYTNSEEVTEMVVESRLIEGVLDSGRVFANLYFDTRKQLVKTTIKEGFFIGTTIALGGYFMYNELVKGSKIEKKIKSKFKK